MENKIKYQSVECDVVTFEALDVIATSVPTGSSGGNIDDAWDTN